MKRRLVIANWKMAPDAWSEARSIFLPIKRLAARLRRVETVICPPAVFLKPLGERLTGRSHLLLGAQDAFWESNGAYTGQLNAVMLKYAGASYVLLGHSEKRALGDTDALINQKIKAAFRAGLGVVFCLGEKERDGHGKYLGEIREQVIGGLRGLPRRWFSQLVAAYEPVWAIGEGRAAADTPAGFLEQSLFIRKVVSGLVGNQAALALPVLYGGSVDAKNAGAFLAEGRADGLLVGRASLRPDQFKEIMRLAEKQPK